MACSWAPPATLRCAALRQDGSTPMVSASDFKGNIPCIAMRLDVCSNLEW